MPTSATQAVSERPGDQPDRLVDAIRRDIISGALEPGAVLRQQTLAERFETSRMPVREALRRLEREGLARVVANKGATVAPLDIAELTEIVDMRVASEVLAIRRAIPQISDAVIGRAEAIQDRAERSSVEEFGDLNRDFHATLYGACAMPRLLDHIGGLNTLAERYLRYTIESLDYAGRSNEEHRALLQACRRRDEDAAATILGAHIFDAGQELCRFLQDRLAND